MRRLMRTRRRTRGLTLIELLVGFVIVGVLATAASPFFADYIANSRLREAGNLLLSETLIAQSEAIKRNTRVDIVTTATTVTVRDVTDPSKPEDLRTNPLPSGVSMAVRTATFGSDGRPATFPAAAPVAIDLSHATLACSANIRCPGLRIGAGGQVSLCRDRTGSCP